jgi:hypothetical protein
MSSYPIDPESGEDPVAARTKLMIAVERTFVSTAETLARISAAVSDLYISMKNSRRLSAEVFRKTYVDARKVRRRL